MIRLENEHPTLEQVKVALDIEYKKILRRLITEQARSNKYVRVCKTYHEKYFPDINLTEFLIAMQQPTTQLEITFNIQPVIAPEERKELFGGNVEKAQIAIENAHEDVEELHPRTYHKRSA